MNDLLSVIASLLLDAHVTTTAPATISAKAMTTHVNGTVGLLVFDKSDFKGTGNRGKHAAVALSGFGDVVGVIMNKRGAALCEFDGYYDGECVVLVGCGTSGVAC